MIVGYWVAHLVESAPIYRGSVLATATVGSVPTCDPLLHVCMFKLIPFLTFSLPERQAYETCVVLEARICYNVARLMYLNSER